MVAKLLACIRAIEIEVPEYILHTLPEFVCITFKWLKSDRFQITVPVMILSQFFSQKFKY
jgi:hypothetical protein